MVKARRFLFVSHPAHALISASGEKKKDEKIQRKCVSLDNFTWTSAVLDSRRERGRLLDANNSNMETEGEGKFVSFKAILGSTSLFKMNHSPAGLNCLAGVAFIGSLEQLKDPSWQIQGQISEEKFLKTFFCVCDSCCEQNVDLDREDRRSWRSYHRSITLLSTFVCYVGECALTATIWRERESYLENAAKDIC